MKQKQITEVKRSAPKLRAAALVFSAAFAAAGCGEFPQCQVNYQLAATKTCESSLAKLSKAKKEFKLLDFYAKQAKEKIRAQLEQGKKPNKEIDQFDDCLEEMMYISRDISKLRYLKRATEERTISEAELETKEWSLDQMLKRIEEIKETLLEIVK